MSLPIETILQQQVSQPRCFHPSGAWEEFPRSALERSIVARFEEIAARYPHRVAVKMGDQELTYDELNRAANRVAHAILARRGPVMEPVALLMPLHIDALIAILGILKAGKFYTAPDLRHPAERIQLMLANAQPPLVITQEQHWLLAQSLTDNALASVTLQELTQLNISDANPDLPLGPDRLFSIIYTSGTTGQPKGVYCSQRAVLQRVQRFTLQVHLSTRDRLACTRYPGFTPRDLFAPLLIGGTVFLFNFAAADMAQFIDWMAHEEITILSQSLAGIRLFLNGLDEHNHLPQLRLIQVGSEALQKSDIHLFQQRCAPGCILSGEYGMTETLGGFQSFRVDQKSVIAGERVPAGYSQDGFEVLIVDNAGKSLPANDVGEIVVRSRYLAQGYWRQPELTATRFYPDPTDAIPRLYFTGDLGLLQPDGCLVHLGRKDDQLKIRSFLVEPIEVERALVALGDYREAVVGAQPNPQGEPLLVAWLVPVHATPPPISDVRRALARSLPDYMIPTHFVIVEQMPLTPAGKVDRWALPTPTLDRPASNKAWRAPATPLEQWLVKCWEDVLSVQNIGVDEHFLDLGGNSLSAMRIHARVVNHVHGDLPARLLFECATIAEMALLLTQQAAKQVDEAELEQLLATIEESDSLEISI